MITRLPYEVAKEKGGRYYVHPWGNPSSPIKGSFGDKRHAIKYAARLCDISVEEYKTRRKNKKGYTI